MLRKTKTGKAKTKNKSKKPATAATRMAAYRRRMRAQGLVPVQLWMPDAKSAAFKAESRRQARALAVSDPAGDEIMRWWEGVYEAPE